MKYSIQLIEGWIGFYDRRSGCYGVTARDQERIRCSYALAADIAQMLRSRGVWARVQPVLGIERRARTYNAVK